MYLDKVIKALREYDEVFTSAKKIWQATKDNLIADFGTNATGSSRLYDEKYAAAKELFDTTVATAKQKGISVVTEAFDEIEMKVNEFVTAPVPADFTATLEAIKATGKGLTANEAKVYLAKYQGNYTAYRSLSQYIYENLGIPTFCVRYDAIKNDIEQYKNMSISWFDKYGDNLQTAFFLTDNNNPLEGFDATIEKFLGGNVGAYQSEE